jgi:hypothetical protein
MQSLRIASVLVAAMLGTGLLSAQQSLIVSQGQIIAFSGLDGTTDGDLAPGLLLGERFGGGPGPNPGAIDDSGRVLFRAQLVTSAGAGYPSAQSYLSRGYFLGDSRGNLVKVFRGGDPEPSGTIPGATLQTAFGGVPFTGTPRIASNGLMMFGTTIWDVAGNTITTADDSVLYAGTVGNWQILAREGSVAPGCGGATYSTDFGGMAHAGTAINGAGQFVFQSTLAGPGVVPANDTAWFTGTIGNTQLMLRKGDLAPGGEQVSAIGSSAQMNASGQVLIEVTFLQGSGSTPVTAQNDKALWVYTPGLGVFSEILREGQPSPIAGLNYASPSLSGLSIFNAAGQVIVGMSGELYVVSASNASSVLASNHAAPGVAGANFTTVSTFNMCLTDGATLAFQSGIGGAGITTANDSGLWIGTPGNLVLVAREGDVAPGSGGQTFGNFGGGNLFLNAAGQLLFANALSGGANAQSIYAWDPALGLQPVLFPNDSVEVQPGVFRTLVSVASGPFSSGASRPLGFANDGTATFKPSFSDGSNAVVTIRIGSLTGVPRKISGATGGTHKLHLNAGPAHAGRLYALAGSASGTNPGTPVSVFVVPLNIDAYTDLTLTNANSGPFVNTVGVLNASGRGLGQIVIPPVPGLSGLVVHHAYGVLDAANNLVFVSEAAPLEIIP